MKKTLKNTLLTILTSTLTIPLLSCNSTPTLSSLEQNQLNNYQSFSFTQNTNTWDFREETIYFVMTDRYVDGDKNNNNIYGDEYQPGNLKYYQGGDFKGLIENLDHI